MTFTHSWPKFIYIIRKDPVRISERFSLCTNAYQLILFKEKKIAAFCENWMKHVNSLQARDKMFKCSKRW